MFENVRNVCRAPLHLSSCFRKNLSYLAYVSLLWNTGLEGTYNVGTSRVASRSYVRTHTTKARMRERGAAYDPGRCAVRVRLSEPTRARRAESHERVSRPVTTDQSALSFAQTAEYSIMEHSVRSYFCAYVTLFLRRDKRNHVLCN